MYFIYKLTGYKISPEGVLKPLFSAVIMGVSILLVQLAGKPLGGWNLLLCMLVAVPVYGMVLTGIGGLTKEDLQSLPYLGNRILCLGQRFGTFKN